VTLKFSDQYQQAVSQTDFRARVTAGAFSAAVTAYGATPIADQTKQAQRMRLVNALVQDPAYGEATFAWLIVSQAALNQITDMTDAFIQTTITNNFDAVAQQLFLTP
jgi:hypothetical protein